MRDLRRKANSAQHQVQNFLTKFRSFKTRTQLNGFLVIIKLSTRTPKRSNSDFKASCDVSVTTRCSIPLVEPTNLSRGHFGPAHREPWQHVHHSGHSTLAGFTPPGIATDTRYGGQNKYPVGHHMMPESLPMISRSNTPGKRQTKIDERKK